MVFSITKISFSEITLYFKKKTKLVKRIAFCKRHYLFKNYQPRSCIRFSGNNDEISMLQCERIELERVI